MILNVYIRILREQTPIRQNGIKENCKLKKKEVVVRKI